MKTEFLKMTGHGTSGSDGIEPGIHLRWAFDDKLGFPSCFKLYRRPSDLNNLLVFDFNQIVNSERDFPYVQQVFDNVYITLESAVIEGEQAQVIGSEQVTLDDGRQVPAIVFNGQLVISFSQPVSRLELGFLFSAESSFQINVHSPAGDYSPHVCLGSVIGAKTIAFDAPGTTGLTLSGNGIVFGKLKAMVCTKKGSWTPIQKKCGCGLPLNRQRTNYLEELYSNVPVDLATVLCRLGLSASDQSDEVLEEFRKLKITLLSMLPEGLVIPWGWTLFPTTPNGSDPDTSDHELAFSKYDFLLSQSQHVHYAKVLDFYFLDDGGQENTYYDYKVTATWPESNLRRLEHELTFEDFEIDHHLFLSSNLNENVVLIAKVEPVIAEEDYPAARTTQGLRITSTIFTLINFIKPVTEIQLHLVNLDFLAGQDEIIIEAYKNYLSAPVEIQKLNTERGLIRLRGNQIDTIKIFGTNVVICRLHYDSDSYPVGEQEYIVCGITMEDNYPLEKPTGLKASLLPGGSVNDPNGTVIERPYVAGLRWHTNEDPDARLLSLAPIMYQLERRPSNGQFVNLTNGSPVFVTPSVIDRSVVKLPAGWPKKRQFYLDNLQDDRQYFYRIAAQDLFGRESGFTDEETYASMQTKPSHPLDVTAQFLDYSTYDPSSDSFTDVTLNDVDQAWLRSNQHNAIVVRWQWPENLQLHSPEVDGFNVFYKAGWLNSYSGEITDDFTETTINIVLTRQEAARYGIFGTSPVRVPAYKFKTKLKLEETISADAFRLCWLTQGTKRFLVLKNTQGRMPFIWVLDQRTLVNYVPEINKGFGVALMQQSNHFIDYRDPQNWTDNSISYHKPKDGGMEAYTIYIHNPAFPDPEIQPMDKAKVRYGQIAVNAQIGALQGSVSPASPIMAIYRNPPATPIAFVPAGDEVEALKATPANVHGKSSFALRWNKTHSILKHHVYRALDDTLFMIDRDKRLTRSDSLYENFKNAHLQFDAADVDIVKQISHQTDIKLLSQHYAGLTPLQLQILASLPDNESAFTQLTGTAIDESHPDYEDRITEIPHPLTGATYIPDPANVLLYFDKTLDGRGSNRYFYALKTLDTNGLMSDLSLATLPVECPKTTPPPPPVLTSVLGGENLVKVKWAKNPGADIAGYLLYRTQEKQLATDWRRMELVKANATHEFTVAINGALPTKEFEFIDASAVARQAYSYGVVAVGLSDEGKWLKSPLSTPKSGQAYDLTPPEPPVWDEVNSGWVYVDENENIFEWEDDLTMAVNPLPAIRLVWVENAISPYNQISRQMEGGMTSAIILSFETGEWFANGYKVFIDKDVKHPNVYTYKAKSKSNAGLISRTESFLKI